jgi:hypothetical protein
MFIVISEKSADLTQQSYQMGPNWNELEHAGWFI